jgi:hypothetical protein
VSLVKIGSFIVFTAIVVSAFFGAGCGSAGDGPSVGPYADDEAPLTVQEAITLGEVKDATVVGSLLSQADGVRLCSALAESYPPQCGGDSLRVEGLDIDALVGLSRTDPQDGPGRTAWADYPVTLSGSLAGGTLAVGEMPPPAGQAESGPLTVLFDYAPRPLRSPGVAFWIMELRNTSDADMRLTFGSGQKAEVVLGRDGAEVYRWSSEKAFTQAIEEVVVPAGESLPVVMNETLWLEPGEYEVEAWITASLEGGGEPPGVSGVVKLD